MFYTSNASYSLLPLSSCITDALNPRPDDNTRIITHFWVLYDQCVGKSEPDIVEMTFSRFKGNLHILPQTTRFLSQIQIVAMIAEREFHKTSFPITQPPKSGSCVPPSKVSNPDDLSSAVRPRLMSFCTASGTQPSLQAAMEVHILKKAPAYLLCK
jgi:hypothetical protein